MEYHEIKVFSFIRQSYALTTKNFEISCFRFLDGCQILLKVNLIKLDNTFSILNQINNDTQFTMEKIQAKLPYLDIMVNKTGTKIWMNIYNKPTNLICTQQADISHLRQTTCLTGSV